MEGLALREHVPVLNAADAADACAPPCAACLLIADTLKMKQALNQVHIQAVQSNKHNKQSKINAIHYMYMDVAAPFSAEDILGFFRAPPLR